MCYNFTFCFIHVFVDERGLSTSFVSNNKLAATQNANLLKMSVSTGDNGNDDLILPWYRTRVEEAYLNGVADGFKHPVVVILDPLYEPCQAIVIEAFGPEVLSQYRSHARNDDIPSMLVGGWRQDSARHFLREQPGVNEIIDAITATGDFAIFIFDGDGPRWFNCPVPSRKGN